ncbi:MAG: pitrilysin family protein [Gammaproteobacteria bacterium]
MRDNVFLRICVLLIAAVSPQIQASPEIQSWSTQHGAKVLFVENTMLPMLDVRIVFDAASARDGDLPGVAMLTNGLLAEGAAGKDAQALAELLESVGAQFDNGSLRDMAYVGVRTLTDEKYLDAAINTLADVLSRPDFPQSAFDRELARMKVALEARKQSPADIAEEAFFKAVYADHPYARPSGGTLQSLAQIKLEDVKAFYQRYYVASNAAIAIVGAVDRERAEEIVERLMANLPAGSKPEPLPAVPELVRAQTIKIDYPSKQSHIYMGQPGMKRTDEDFFDLYVANHPFGGSGFASRLVGEIREDRGLAYSVSSNFSPMRAKGPFIISMQTRADQTEQALTLLESELKKYVAEGPDKAELEHSISNITGSYPLSLDSNSKLLGSLAMMAFYDLPEDYLETYIANVRKVNKSDIKRVLKNRIDVDNMVTVVVGNGG